MSAVLYEFPPLYHIAYTTDDGLEGLVSGFCSRRIWEVEAMLFFLSESHPELTFWRTDTNDSEFAINCMTT